MARRGFYASLQRQEAPGNSAMGKAAITAEIEAVFQEHRGFYRSRGSIRCCGPPAATVAAIGAHGSCVMSSSGLDPPQGQLKVRHMASNAAILMIVILEILTSLGPVLCLY